MIEVVARSRKLCMKNYISLKRAVWWREEKSPQFIAFLIEFDFFQAVVKYMSHFPK